MKVATWVALSMSVAAWLVSYVPGHRRLEQPLEQPQDVDVEAERPNGARSSGASAAAAAARDLVVRVVRGAQLQLEC